MKNDLQTEVPSQTMNVSIEKMVYGGDGLARTPDGVLLTPLVLTGEKVTVGVEEQHKGVRRGRLVDVLEPSSDRIHAECSYFTRCGGCHYQHISYERQLEIKQQIFAEALERIGKIRLDVPISVLASPPWEYRNRSRFQVTKEGSHFEIGYFELLSHRLCAIESCPISSPAINRAIGALNQHVGAACFPDGSAELELFASDRDDALLATVYSRREAPTIFGDELHAAIPELKSVAWQQKAAGAATARMSTWGNGSIAYQVGAFHYRIGHGSFFQINRFLLDAFIGTVVEGLAGKQALDLYAGAGLFTIPLAQAFEKVAAVESNLSSGRDLASNIGVVSDRVRSYRLTAEKFMATATSDWEAIVADPPRSGLSKPVLENVCRIRPRRFVYVSCDPTTLARDLAALIASGYRIKSVHLIDLFPQTFHIESVVHLEKAE